MPLGMLARDSIQDLASLGSSQDDSKRRSQSQPSKQPAQVEPNAPANPQQAQVETYYGNRARRHSQERLAPPLYHQDVMVDYSYADTAAEQVYQQHYRSGDPQQQRASTRHSPLQGDGSRPIPSENGNIESSSVWTLADDSSAGKNVFQGNKPPWWQCCLFPWLMMEQQRHKEAYHRIDALQDHLEWGNDESEDLYESLDSEHVSAQAFSDASKIAAIAAVEAEANGSDHSSTNVVEEDQSKKQCSGMLNDDDASTNSDALGEPLSEKDRQAVLARLRLSDPSQDETGFGNESTHHTSAEEAHSSSPLLHSASSSPQQHKGLLNGIAKHLQEGADIENSANTLTSNTTKKPLRPILRRSIVLKPQESLEDAISNVSSCSDLESSQIHPMTSQHGSLFTSAPRRRMLFPQYAPANKSQRSKDCSVNFAPMARVVTIPPVLNSQKPDIWWTKADYEAFRRTGRMITKAMMEGGSEIWLAESAKDGAANAASGSSGGANQAGSTVTNSANKNPTTFKPGDKWWHRFGHSRRGLEHVVSFEEGRQRQQNVRTAIASVLEEQARQARYNRVDPEKLRMISLHHTNWARDLAIAAGESDADAVRSSFAEDRKSREFYLLKMAGKSSDPNKATTSQRIPEFMQSPVARRKELLGQTGLGATAVALSPTKLDANTAAQISFRRAQLQQKAQESRVPSTPTIPPSVVTKEPLRDAEKRSTLAQRAKGFSMGEDAKLDMGAVMSGLGPVEQSSTHASTAGSTGHSDTGSLCGGSSPASSVTSATRPCMPPPQTVSS